MGSYMRAKADRYVKERRRCNVPQLLLRVVWGFIRSYFIRQGFRDGVMGVVVAISVSVDAVAGLAIAGQHQITPEAP
jgi:hypothetical protein